jgi:light-harvesting protein B-800-850 alpha chain
VASLIVHFAILSHTTWFSAYWQGGHGAKTSMAAPAPAVGGTDLAALTTKPTN